MPVDFTFTPPAVPASALIHAVKEAAELAGGEVLLAASRPLVPVDTGQLRDSGKVEHGELGAEVSYTRIGADGYNVAARQHEDATLNHPKGGQSHYLSTPMTADAPAILAAMAATLKAL